MLRSCFCILLALLLALSLLTPAPPAHCQAVPPKTTDVVAALSGSLHPLSLKLRDLDESWRTFSLSGASDASSQLAYFALLIGGGQSIYGGQNIYYTHGETVTLGGEVYLVAYQRGTVKYAVQPQGNLSHLPPPPKPTPETVLSLSLLNLHTLSGLNNVQSFSLQEALDPYAAPPSPDSKEASVSNLKQLGLACDQYMQDYDARLPPMKTAAVAKAALYPYIKSESVFVQPETNKPYLPNTSLSGRSLSSFNDPSSMVIYYEAAPEDDNLRAVLFLDGHVKRIADADWQRVKSASHVPNPPQSI